MKLIFCPECQDVRKIDHTKVVCFCGASSGKYIDDINAVISGSAIPLGFDNYAFAKALIRRPTEGMGRRFQAFVIPKICPTIEEVEKID